MKIIDSILNRLPKTDDGFYTLADIASALGLNEAALARANRRGGLGIPNPRRGDGRGRPYLFTRDEIEEALLANCVPTPRPKRH
jgi:hypothetical protein